MAVATAAHPYGALAEEPDQLYVETRELRIQGFLLFMVSDLVLFSSFIFAYLYLRNSGQGWPAGGPKLDIALAAINSIVLFGSGATMHFALENWKHGSFSKFANWIVMKPALSVEEHSPGTSFGIMPTLSHSTQALHPPVQIPLQ